MPATATGRGAQVVLDPLSDTARAVRGAYAPSYEGNAAKVASDVLTGVVSDGNHPDGTTSSGPATDVAVIPMASSAALSGRATPLQTMASSAMAAKTSNPNLNPAMTTPPVITDNAAATLTHVYSVPASNVMNQYGGVPTDDGFGYNKYPSVTFSGQPAGFISRIEVNADATMVEFTIFNSGAGYVRFIVNGQFASKTIFSPVASSVRHVRLDFTSAGGRAKRTITMECQKFVDFQSVAVGATETVSRASAKPPRMYIVGDSYTQAGGASQDVNCYAAILGDLLGIKDVWNGGVGGTGFLATSSGAQRNFRQRLSDLVIAAPDLVLICGGLNDSASAPAAISAEVTAYLRAIRATPVLASIPIVMMLNANGTPLATTQPMETAMSSAMAAFRDPLMYFIPNVNDPNGPMFTGTGYTSVPNGSGNCDVYIGVDAIHPNDAGHAYMAGWIADAMRRVVFQV